MIGLYNFLLAYTYILYNLYMKICVLSSSCMFTGAHPPPTKTTYPPKPPVSGNSLEAATAHHNGTRKRCSPLSKRRSLRITRREFNMEELASMIGWQWWMIFTENDSMYCVIYIYTFFHFWGKTDVSYHSSSHWCILSLKMIEVIGNDWDMKLMMFEKFYFWKSWPCKIFLTLGVWSDVWKKSGSTGGSPCSLLHKLMQIQIVLVN